jgi:hypothetical protein
MGIRDRPISARSPWQNGLAERLSALTTSLSLASGIFVHLLRSYEQYCNESRRHLSLKKDAPIPRDVKRAGRVLALPILGGLHHRYVRV